VIDQGLGGQRPVVPDHDVGPTILEGQRFCHGADSRRRTRTPPNDRRSAGWREPAAAKRQVAGE
jgi:hypothetical protein